MSSVARLFGLLVASFGVPCVAAQAPSETAVPATQVTVVPVVGSVNVGNAYAIQSALREAPSAGVRYIVIEIDTEGALTEGAEFQALIDAVLAADTSVVAYVRRNAFSTGAWLALACDQVFMAPGARLGAITLDAGGPEGVDASISDQEIGFLRATVRDLAVRSGRIPEQNLAVAEAMVDPRMEVYEVTYVAESGLQQTEVLEKAAVRALQERGLTIANSTQLGPVPLTLDVRDATRLGYANGSYSSIEEMVRDEFGLPAGSIAVRSAAWSEEAVAWLEAMKPVLFLLGFVLLLLELKTPGFAVPGVLGVLMLAMAMFSSYLVGLADWTEILLFFAGIGLVAAEIFVAPGTIAFGLAGVVCIFVGLVLSQQSFVIPSTEAEHAILAGNMLRILLLVLFAIAAAVAMWRLTPYIPLLNRILQKPPPSPATGSSTQFARSAEAEALRSSLIGRFGVAVSDLRPVGMMAIGDDRYDALAEGTFVARGATVRVIEVNGNQIVVEPVEASGESGQVSVGLLVLLWTLGLCMAIAEIFFPSLGVLSILSAVSFVSAIFFAYTQHSLAAGHAMLATTAVVVPTIIYYTLKVLPKTRFGNVLLQIGPAHEEVARAAEEPNLDRFLGRTGVAISDLRPSGSARLGTERVDVITRGELIEKGTPVRVLQVDSNRVVVTRHQGAEPES